MGVLTPDDFTASELDTWMSHALEEARAAESHGDVPVGAVVIHRHSVIASRHNERELTGDPTSHAEVLALRRRKCHWQLASRGVPTGRHP